MTIREAVPLDIPDLSRLAAQTYTEAFGHAFTAEELAEKIRTGRSEAYFTRALSESTVLVVEEAGELIGYAQFGPSDSDYPGSVAGDMELSRLYVHAGFQGKGIGKALLDHVLAYPEMQEAGQIFLDVWEENHGAKRLYESYGFVDTGLRDSDSDIIMVRKNSPASN